MENTFILFTNCTRRVESQNSVLSPSCHISLACICWLTIIGWLVFQHYCHSVYSCNACIPVS